MTASGGTGPELDDMAGAPLAVGEYGVWIPLGAEATSTGYEVAWKDGSADEYTVWQTDGSGHFLSSTASMSGSSSALETSETSFHQDLNGDGIIGVPTTTGGTTTSGGTTSSAPVLDFMATYTVPNGVTNIQLAGTTAQTITANNQGDTITSNNYGSTIIGGSGNDTLIAGKGADHLTGGAGSDTFVFNSLPTQAGHITDFNTKGDVLDLSGIFSSIGYSGNNPLKGGYLSFASDGHGDTNVYVNAHNGAGSILITTLDHVSSSSITPSDWIWHH
jgi:Ca2+-binding RTX toxin-like protein